MPGRRKPSNSHPDPAPLHTLHGSQLQIEASTRDIPWSRVQDDAATAAAPQRRSAVAAPFPPPRPWRPPAPPGGEATITRTLRPHRAPPAVTLFPASHACREAGPRRRRSLGLRGTPLRRRRAAPNAAEMERSGEPERRRRTKDGRRKEGGDGGRREEEPAGDRVCPGGALTFCPEPRAAPPPFRRHQQRGPRGARREARRGRGARAGRRAGRRMHPPTHARMAHSRRTHARGPRPAPLATKSLISCLSPSLLISSAHCASLPPIRAPPPPLPAPLCTTPHAAHRRRLSPAASRTPHAARLTPHIPHSAPPPRPPPLPAVTDAVPAI